MGGAINGISNAINQVSNLINQTAKVLQQSIQLVQNVSNALSSITQAVSGNQQDTQRADAAANRAVDDKALEAARAQRAQPTVIFKF